MRFPVAIAMAGADRRVDGGAHHRARFRARCEWVFRGWGWRRASSDKRDHRQHA